jgi:hypothetical protein
LNFQSNYFFFFIFDLCEHNSYGEGATVYSNAFSSPTKFFYGLKATKLHIDVEGSATATWGK